MERAFFFLGGSNLVFIFLFFIFLGGAFLTLGSLKSCARGDLDVPGRQGQGRPSSLARVRSQLDIAPRRKKAICVYRLFLATTLPSLCILFSPPSFSLSLTPLSSLRLLRLFKGKRSSLRMNIQNLSSYGE